VGAVGAVTKEVGVPVSQPSGISPDSTYLIFLNSCDLTCREVAIACFWRRVDDQYVRFSEFGGGVPDYPAEGRRETSWNELPSSMAPWDRWITPKHEINEIDEPDGLSLPDAELGEVPESTDSEILDQASDGATEEVRAFVDDTLKAFAQEGLRIAAHAVGLGPVYEVYYWGSKAVNAGEALVSDNGVELGLPVPVGGLDLMVHVSIADGQADGSQPPVTMSFAPGDDSLAGALEIGPARPHDEQVNEPTESESAEVVPRSHEMSRPDIRAVESVEVHDHVAVAVMDLSVIKRRPRGDRLAVLQDIAARELRPQLTERSEIHDLAMVIGYDPALGLAFWTRVGRDVSHVWRIVAEYDLATERLVMGEPEPASSDPQRDRRIEYGHQERISKERPPGFVTENLSQVVENLLYRVTERAAAITLNQVAPGRDDLVVEMAEGLRTALDDLQHPGSSFNTMLKMSYVLGNSGFCLWAEPAPTETGVPHLGSSLARGSCQKEDDGHAARFPHLELVGFAGGERRGGQLGEASGETIFATGAVVCGSAAAIAAAMGTRILDADVLLAYVRQRIWGSRYGGRSQFVVPALRAVGALQVIVFLDPSIGGGLWIDVDPVRQVPAASLLIEADLSAGAPGRFRFFGS
jgi:hypothetical protein